MSTILATADAGRSGVLARARDYLELTKPRIAVLELVTVAVAAVVAGRGLPEGSVLLYALIGTALVAAGASAWNQWLERESDARMPRTADRPLPAGRLAGREALAFGTLTTIAGVTILAVAVNLPTALVAAATWALYVAVYTPLKSRTPHNTAIGAVAGAMPVLIGWTAVGAPWDWSVAALFAIVFLWQFPHFMAIAWMYRYDYAAAGLRMLSVDDPSGRRAARAAVLGAALVCPLGALSILGQPATVGAWICAAVLVALGIWQCACAVGFARTLDHRSARRLLRASLIYLPLVLMLSTIGPLAG